MRNYPEPDGLIYAGAFQHCGVRWGVLAVLPAPDDERLTAYLCPASRDLERLDIVIDIATGFVLPVSSFEQPDAELLHAASLVLGKSLLPGLRRVLPIARGQAHGR